MAKVDYRIQCGCLEQVPCIKGDTVPTSSKAYFCSKTSGRCVGAKEGFFIWSDDTLIKKLVERCPGREPGRTSAEELTAVASQG